MIEVQLYIKRITDPERITQEELQTLPAYRRERIEKMKYAPGKAALFTAGLLLRDILGVRKDEDLIFGEQGKPYLVSGSPSFSVSHDNAFAVLATAPSGIGADTENSREFSDSLIKRVFNCEEQSFIAQDPKRNALYLWTRLEAALKLSGEGISGLDHRLFSLLKDSEACCFYTLQHEDSVISIACGEGFTTAVHIL